MVVGSINMFHTILAEKIQMKIKRQFRPWPALPYLKIYYFPYSASGVRLFYSLSLGPAPAAPDCGSHKNHHRYFCPQCKTFWRKLSKKVQNYKKKSKISQKFEIFNLFAIENSNPNFQKLELFSEFRKKSKFLAFFKSRRKIRKFECSNKFSI